MPRPVKVRFGVNVTHHCLYRVGRILHDVALAMWSAVGQAEKNSLRAYVFRFALELGHCSTQSACLKRVRDRHYSIASAARTVPRIRLTPRDCLLTLNRQRSGSLFRTFAAVATRLECVAQYWPPVPPRGYCQRRMEVFVSPRCFSTG